MVNLTLLIPGNVPGVQVSDDVGLAQNFRSPYSWLGDYICNQLLPFFFAGIQLGNDSPYQF